MVGAVVPARVVPREDVAGPRLGQARDRSAGPGLVGAQPYRELPRWAKAFDVAIIPYRHNRQVANANPLKVREYLATGKPVVSVSQPEIDKFARWVEIAPDREGFLHALDRALQNDSPAAADARVAAVAGQTWDNRVDEVLREVSSALARKQA